MIRRGCASSLAPTLGGVLTSCTTGGGHIRPSPLPSYDVPMVSHSCSRGRSTLAGSPGSQPSGTRSSRGWCVNDSLITCSASMNDLDHSDVQARAGRITVIRNGIDALAVRGRRPRGPAELLYVGRLGTKGVHDAIAALPRLRHSPRHHSHRRRRRPADWLIDQARKHRVLKARFVRTPRPHQALALLHRDAPRCCTDRLGWWREAPQPAPAGDVQHRRSG